MVNGSRLHKRTWQIATTLGALVVLTACIGCNPAIEVVTGPHSATWQAVPTPPSFLLSPDGGRLFLCGREGKASIVDLRAGTIFVLPDQWRSTEEAAWTGDGSRLVALQTRAKAGWGRLTPDSDETRLCLMDLTNRRVRPLTSWQPFGAQLFPAMMPGDSGFIYQALDGVSETDVFSVHRRDMDGVDRRVVIGSLAHISRQGDTGEAIVFRSALASGRYRYYIQETAGCCLEILPEYRIRSVAVGPQGKQLACLCEPCGKAGADRIDSLMQVWLVRAAAPEDGICLGEGRFDASQSKWSGDGKYLALSEKPDTPQAKALERVVIISLANGSVNRLKRSDGTVIEGGAPQWGPRDQLVYGTYDGVFSYSLTSRSERKLYPPQ